MTRFPTRTSTTTTTSLLLMTLIILLCPIVSVTSWSTTTTAGTSFGLITTYARNNLPKTTLRRMELQMSNDDDDDDDDKWDEEEHLAHGLNDVHEETSDELKDSEEAAAWDAHDLSDPGMEAAAEERAVMLANEITHKMKQDLQNKKKKESPKKDWNDEHLAHGIDEVHEETSEELLEAEEAAAVDAHDVSDAGMEAAAEERAVMIANEMVHKMKEKASASAAAKASADKKTKE